MVSFEEYLNPGNDGAGFAANRNRFAGAFADQRCRIAQVVGAMQPKRVACFGAGILNDIPMDELVRAGAEVHLVDWVGGILEFGLAHSILSVEGGNPECIFCELGDSQASGYCQSYTPPEPGAGVCAQYVPSGGDVPACAAYSRGDQPACTATTSPPATPGRLATACRGRWRTSSPGARRCAVRAPWRGGRRRRTCLWTWPLIPST